MAQTPEPTNGSPHSPELYCPNCAREVDDLLAAALLGPLVELVAQTLVSGNGFFIDHDALGNFEYRLAKKTPRRKQRGAVPPSVVVGFRVVRHSGTIAKVPIGVSICKKEKPPGTQSGAASGLLKSSPKKGSQPDDIPPYVWMSGQCCTNRDFKGYGVPKWEDSAPGKCAEAVSQPLNLEAPKGAVFHMEACTKTAAPLFIQKDVEEGVVDPNLAVIFDEAQFPEAIHKKTHARSGSANHLCQDFLADFRNHRLGLALLAELRQQ